MCGLKNQLKKEETLSDMKWVPQKMRDLIKTLNQKLHTKILSDINPDISNLQINASTQISANEIQIVTDCLGILKTLEVDNGFDLSKNCFYQSLMKTMRVIDPNDTLVSDLSTSLIHAVQSFNS